MRAAAQKARESMIAMKEDLISPGKRSSSSWRPACWRGWKRIKRRRSAAWCFGPSTCASVSNGRCAAVWAAADGTARVTVAAAMRRSHCYRYCRRLAFDLTNVDVLVHLLCSLVLKCIHRILVWKSAIILAFECLAGPSSKARSGNRSAFLLMHGAMR